MPIIFLYLLCCTTLKNTPTGCDILSRMNATHGLYEQARTYQNTYDTVFSYIGEPSEKHHIISVGFVEGSGPYKKIMDMYDEYQARGFLAPIIVITKKAWDKKVKVRNFFSSRDAIIYFVDDTNRDYTQPIEESYREINTVFAEIVSNHQIQGCVSHGRQTFFPFACEKNNIPYVMMHGSGPDLPIEDTTDAQGFPKTMFYYKSYEQAKAYLITILQTPVGKIQEHFRKYGFETHIPFVPVFQPYKTVFQENIRNVLHMSPYNARQQIATKTLFQEFDENMPLVYLSWSGSLFDLSELDNPDSVFIQQHLDQSEECLCSVMHVVDRIAKEYGMLISLYIDKEGRALLMQKYPDRRNNVQLLTTTNSYLYDEDYFLLRKGGVEITRAASTSATTIGYGVGGIPTILTVPYEDSARGVADYMFETASAERFEDLGCPVIRTETDIEAQLYATILAMLKYKNTHITWFSHDKEMLLVL